MEIKTDEDLHPVSLKPLPIDRPIPCRHCHRSYKATNVRDLHERIHLTPYICDYCQQPFALKSHMKNHLDIHRRMINPYEKVKKNQHSIRFKAGTSQYTCDYCDKQFYSKLGYTGHLRLKHYDETIVFVKEEQVESEEEEPDEQYFGSESQEESQEYIPKVEGHFSCSCGEKFVEFIDLVRHESSQHTEIFEKMVKGLKDLLLYVINREEPPKREKKIMVIKKEEEEEELQVEPIIEDNLESSDESEQEEIKPTVKKKEKRTRKQENTKQDKFLCQYCDKQLAHKKSLEYHVAKKHQNVPVYRCKFCNRYFTDKEEFNAHVKAHDRDPELCCSACGYMCKGAAVLNRHVIQKHKAIEQDPRFFCKECNKGFYYKCKLDEHAVIHKPHNERPLLYNCDVCEMSFNRKSAVTRHRMTHDESTKIFTCTFCAKTFRRRQHLTNHLAMHTGARPREEICADCGAIYSERRGLYNHMLRVHGRPLEGYKKQNKVSNKGE